MKNIFSQEVNTEILSRIDKLTSKTKPLWGKMAVAQMLAHCNITYELVYDEKIPKATGFKKWLLKTLIKNTVVSEKPYKKNSRTAPVFIVSTDKDFDSEKNRLVSHIQKTQELGETYFDGKESNAFGILTKTEWNNMFYKHLDHHLNQFGV
jgi:hypothetical protein